MSADEIVKMLIELAQLDVDAMLAYEQVIRNLDEGEVELTAALEEFENDHLEHVDALSDVIRGFGVRPPEFKRDVKGFFIEGVTGLMSRMGTRAALLAMTQSEGLTNAAYKAALTADMPPRAHALVRKHYNDEQRHLAFITETLKARSEQSHGIMGLFGTAAHA